MGRGAAPAVLGASPLLPVLWAQGRLAALRYLCGSSSLWALSAALQAQIELGHTRSSQLHIHGGSW